MCCILHACVQESDDFKLVAAVAALRRTLLPSRVLDIRRDAVFAKAPSKSAVMLYLPMASRRLSLKLRSRMICHVLKRCVGGNSGDDERDGVDMITCTAKDDIACGCGLSGGRRVWFACLLLPCLTSLRFSGSAQSARSSLYTLNTFCCTCRGRQMPQDNVG